MQKISSASTSSRTARRSVIWASAIVSSAVLVSAGGCRGEDGSPSATGGLSGTGPTTSAGASGIPASYGGNPVTTGGASTSGGRSGSGGALAGNGGLGTSGALTGSGGSVVGSGGTSSGGTGGTGKPCVDVEPPPDPKWPGATCQSWATETTECTAPWFSQYCDASCGRCVPAGGGGSSSGGTGGKPCTDVTPPPDPEWPGATCKEWATETTECTAAWFKSYCDASCGRCVPEGGGGTGGATGTAGAPAGVDCSKEGLPNVTGGDGFATRYWDCCQPHCSQFNGHRCSQDGVSNTGDTTSACSGGGSFACYDEAPRAVSDCLAYGHIAKSNPNCGGCYRIQFTGEGQHNANDPGSKLIKGKQMIVKVTNTGGDVAGNQFDLMIPGGGVGQFNACSRQWGSNDLGAQYGGFLTECTGSHAAKKDCVRQECMKIPSGPARNGCLWFVDWLQAADNPKFTSQQTNCPF